MARRLDDVRLAVLMLDGIDLKGRTNIVALGITSEGVKIPLGLWAGSTENSTVATALLSDLVERGLDTTQGVLCVIDGSKALRKAIRDVLGEHAPVHRCVRHKERNVLGHLPNATGDSCAGGCERPGMSPATIGLWSASSCLQVSSHTRTQVLPARCARGWPRRSP